MLSGIENHDIFDHEVNGMENKLSKNSRILDLYQRLCAGKLINKAVEARRFGIDERSLQRDIDDIRAFFAEQSGKGDTREIVYDRKRKGFVLAGYQSPLMTNGEILAVSKILLESRAFPRKEMLLILDKLTSGCVPQRSMKLVTDLLANEKYHYNELTRPVDIQETVWALGEDIRDRRLLELTYQLQDPDQPPVPRIVEPLAILFSEYYFYLNAHIVEPDGQGGFRHKHDYPAVFRVDRIMDYHIRDDKFNLPYTDRFQEGEFRKRVQFMYAGPLIQIRFRFTGKSIDSVLDRLPTAQIVKQDENGFTIKAEVYGHGIMMWLLSQGARVEILAPEQLRAEMRDILRLMLQKYEG